MRNSPSGSRDGHGDRAPAAAPPSIDRYNDEAGQIYASSPELFMFSPAFCRCEGQTRLFSRWAAGQTRVEPAHLVSLARFFGKVFRDLLFSLGAPAAELNTTPGQGVFVFSYFDSRNDAGGTLREEYFRGVLDGDPDVRCFYKLVNPGILFPGIAYLRSIASLKKNYAAYAEHSFISPGMIATAVRRTLSHWAAVRAIRLRAGQDAGVFGLLMSAHRNEICDGTVYFGYLQQLLFESLLRQRPRIVLSVWENSPWERILEHAKKQISPATVSRGFQHTGFSKKLLQHYPSRHERGLGTYPDRLLSNGQVNRDELSRHAVISSDIVVGGALRQDGMLSKGLGKLEDLRPGRPINIAYAFSWDQTTYPRILEDLELLPQGVTVYLKFHPDYPNWLKRRDFPARFINSRASWSEIGSICPLALANDNSLMFEGYYHGMHTVVYDGADPWGLEKRDFGSPFVHLTRSELPTLLSNSAIGRINAATRVVLGTRYLQSYFAQRDAASLKKTFTGSESRS